MERLEAAGYTLAPFGEPVELGIINTCTVTREADAKSRKMIRAFVRKNPQAFLAVVGCYAQLSSHALAAIEGVDLILGNREKLDVLKYVTDGKNRPPVIVCGAVPREDFAIPVACGALQTRRANLKIQDGCGFRCSYCVVPAARGAPRSRTMDNLLEEARQRVRCGVKEIVLTGVNVGLYRFQGHTLLDVIDRLNEIEGLRRIRLSSIELNTVPEGLFERMNDPQHALVPHLHVPLQSGSDKVLVRMNRKYSRAEFADFLRRADCAVRDLCLGTDVLVGMPGESEEDFEDTCRLVRESPITYAHVFRYSEREGTPAVELGPTVAPGIRKERSTRLRKISAEKRRQYYRRYLGTTQDVLFEEQEAGHWCGYTRNYIRVAVCSTERLENTIVAVTLEREEGGRVLGPMVER